MRLSRIAKSLDYTLLGVVALILVMGFFVLQSATVNASIRYDINFVMRQALWAVVGLGAFCCVLFFDYSKLAKFGIPIFALNILLLVATLFLGKETNGSQAWIPIGPFKLQPAEIVKILLIVGLAQFLVPRIGKLNTIKDLLPVFLYVGVPLGLILLQPDLGTGLVYVAIMFGMLLVAGASPLLLSTLLGGGIGAIAVAVFGHYTWGWWLPLKTYQLNRLIAFINPMVDPHKAGWNVIQSQIAVGSGGLWGKGLGMGSQNINNFLPAQWTDFIFCVFAEELGFIGAVVLLALFFILIYRGIRIARRAKDPFGALIAVGVISMFTFHVLQNIGMAIGVMPITGIPLPFVSYGGSSLLANMLALGMLMNVYVYHDDRLMY
ncbi:MAG: rod shape-determining protein RodA [Peptococcia bacterium]|jgi:rod shape determining protein RodA